MGWGGDGEGVGGVIAFTAPINTSTVVPYTNGAVRQPGCVPTFSRVFDLATWHEWRENFSGAW